MPDSPNHWLQIGCLITRDMLHPMTSIPIFSRPMLTANKEEFFYY